MVRNDTLLTKLWATLVWAFVGFFVINLIGLIAAVVVNSFATRWLGTWLPAGYTTSWFASAWDEFQLADVLQVTIEVVGAVVLVSGVVGVPAAYAMARREFPGKRAVMLLFLLPLLVPPITFGIPLATVLYQHGRGGHDLGRDPGQSRADRAIRDPGHDPVHRADRPAHRGRGARVRRRHAAHVHQCAGAAAGAGHAGGAAAGAGAHDRDVRADLPDRRADQPDAGRGALLLPCSPPACAPGSRSTRWR